MDGISVRDYARRENISLGTAYRRIWEGRVRATKSDGCWLILSPETSIQIDDGKRTVIEPDGAL